MERMEGASRDEVSANVEALKKVFPAAVKEGKVDMEALKTLLGCEVEADTGCYRMTWNGKEAARQFALKRSHGTLLPDRGSSRDWETTQNVYIEGDNLEVLKLLQGGYYNSVKMIYIDPPYNTGHDFVYHDNFHDSIENYKKLTGQVNADGVKLKTNVETSGRYHTDWLNMMLPRLILARNLLRDDGVIFISIDDNEVTNLRKLCDEVFGEENFVAQVVVQTNPRGKTFDRFISSTHETVLVYAKDILEECMRELPKDEEALSAYSKEDERGKYRLLELRNRNPVFHRGNRPLMFYPFYADPKTFEVSLKKDGRYSVEILPRNSKGVDGCWTWGVVKAAENIGLLVANQASTGKWTVFRKDYLEGESYYTKPKGLWLEKEMNHENGKEELSKLFGTAAFDFPKSVGLIKKCVKLGSMKGDIVLDFFSGSATTAHAVMKLNAEDGETRRYICVQLPETCPTDGEAARANFKNICEIGKERIRRAGDKVMAEWTARQNEAASQLALDGSADATKSVPPDIGFRVFKLDTSNFVDWNPNSEDLAGDLLKAKDNVLVGRTKEDILYEVIVKCNFQLTDKIAEHKVGNNTIYAVRNGELMICIDDQIPLEVGDEMLRLKHEVYGNPESFRAVFLDNGLSDDSKANIVQRLKGDGVDETCIRCV